MSSQECIKSADSSPEVTMSKQETRSYAAEATDAAAAANSLSVAQANINKQTRAATERSKN